LIALVTGANRGIGREVCKQPANAGCRTILSARNGEKAAAAARSLVAEGLDVSAQTLDVSDQDSIRAAAGDLASRFGRVGSGLWGLCALGFGPKLCSEYVDDN
jgi:NAD(P)-dependent dehydrogenase (short-subunit alcohol dehydrogenase family)